MYAALRTFAQKTLPAWLYEQLIGRWDTHGLKRYTSNTLWALGGRIVNIIVSFSVTIYLVRYLGPENYGQLSYAVSFVGLFSIIAGLGLDNVLYRDVIKYPERRNEYLGSALVLKLVAGALAGVMVAISALLFSQDDVSRLVIFMLGFTFIFNAFNVIGFEFQADVLQKQVSLIIFAVVFILNILKIGVIFAGEGILYIGMILLFEAVLYAAFYIYARTVHYGSIFAWRFDSRVALDLLKDSWPFIFIAAFMTIYARIDQVMLKHLMDSSAVGLYDAAVRIAEAWLFIPAAIASSVFPAIVNAKQASMQEYKKRLLLLCMLMGGMGAVVALPAPFYAGPLMQMLYGPAFAASAGVFVIYIWSSVWVSLDIVVRYFLIAENHRLLIFFVSFGTALVNVVLNFLLIPKFGIIGAAWATFASYVILLLPIVILFRMKHRDESQPIT